MLQPSNDDAISLARYATNAIQFAIVDPIKMNVLHTTSSENNKTAAVAK
jgi:hypothetical protein